MQQETITLENDLTGKLCHKDKPAGHLLVICHGYKSSPAHPSIMAITHGLNKKGYATFTFHFSGSNPLDIERQVRDIHTIVAYFASYQNVTIIGASFGALSSSIASLTSQTKGLITVNGFFGTSKLGWQLYYPFLMFQLLKRIHPKYQNIWRFFKHSFQPSHIQTPTLVIHSKTDRAVSINQSRRFYQALKGPRQFIELASADHELTLPGNADEVITIIDSWLNRTTTSSTA